MAKKAKLKIGLVLDTSLDPTDGVQQYVIHIGEWMRKRGHDIHYLVGETKNRQLPNVHSLARNINVRFNGNRTSIPLPTSTRRLKEFLDQEKFDILHVQMPHSPFMAHRLVLSASDSTAVVGTFHIAAYDWLTSAGNAVLGVWLRPSLDRFDRVVSVSVAAANFASATFGIETDVLPNVIDSKLFQNAKPFSKYKDGTLTILFLGRLVKRKGCQVLLESVFNLTLLPGLPKFRVLICGSGHLEKGLRKYVAQNHLEDIVTFTGFVSEEDKPRYYATADISVFPSSGGESFGIVLLEAMASGKAAVIAGDNPGYHSVMSPQPDLLFEPKDSVELTNKLEYYLFKNGSRAAMASWGEKYTKTFDVDIVGRQLLEIYSQALLKRLNQ